MLGTMTFGRFVAGCREGGAAISRLRDRAAAPRNLGAHGTAVRAALSLDLLLAVLALVAVSGEIGIVPLDDVVSDESLLGAGLKALAQNPVFAFWAQLQATLLLVSADLGDDLDPAWIAAVASAILLPRLAQIVLEHSRAATRRGLVRHAAFLFELFRRLIRTRFRCEHFWLRIRCR